MKRRSLTVLALTAASCIHNFAPDVPRQFTSALQLSERGTSRAESAPLAVVAAGPRGSVDPVADPGITLVFNHPMHRLDAAEGESTATNFRLTTAKGEDVAGTFRWVGSRGVLFEPAARLRGATGYRVTAPAGTRSLDGKTLAADYRFEFETARPQLLAVEPAPSSKLVRPEDKLYLRFSQPVDPEVLLQRATITAASTNKDKLAIQFRVSAERPPGRQARGQEHWLALTPTQPWPKASVLQLTIPPGLTGQEGPLATQTPIEWSAQTYSPLALQNLLCARQTLGRCQAHRDLTVMLSTPVLESELRRHLKFTGPVHPVARRKNAKRSDPVSTSHALGLDPNYGERLEVTLTAGLKDVFGQQLASDVSVDVAIEDPFVVPTAAKADPTCPSTCTPAPASGDDTTPRRLSLQYALSFAASGQILESRANGNPHLLQLGAVNVPTFGLRSQVLGAFGTVRWLGRHGWQDERPEADAKWRWVSPATGDNRQAVETLNLSELFEPSAGQRAVVVEATALGENNLEQRFLQVTDLGVTGRISKAGADVWVTSLASGAPVSGATVELYQPDGKLLASVGTDEQGLARLANDKLGPLTKNSSPQSDLILLARSGSDWTFQRVQPTRSIDPGTWVDFAQESKWLGLVFTDRGVYRPGEVLKAGGYFRRTSDAALMVAKDGDFEYRVNDARGETIAQGRGQLDQYGALSLDLPLPKGTALGEAGLTLRFGRGSGEVFNTWFQVLDYRPAEFKVTAEPTQGEAVRGDLVGVRVHGEYLFGAPVAGANVEQYVSSMPAAFSPPNVEGYATDDSAFSRDLAYRPEPTLLQEQQSDSLDDQGNLIHTLKLTGPMSGSPQRVTFEAEVRDMSAQSQTGRTSVLVHPAAFYLAIAPLKQRFLAVGATVSPEVLTVDPKGKRTNGNPVHVELLRRTWGTAVQDRGSDSLYFNSHVSDEKAGECQFTSGTPACKIRLTQPGYYVLRATSKDRSGNPVHASTSLYALDNRADAGAEPVGWQEPERRGLSLELDKADYQPGETAKLLVKNPFKTATALVTVERGGILSRQVKELRGPMPMIELPIQEDYFPNVFVSVHLLRGRTAPPTALTDANEADVGAPQFRVGYIPLRVNPEARRLVVKVEPDKRAYHPGDTVETTLSLRTPEGAPVSGSVTFYAVDEGVLLLTGYQTPDPLPAFSGPRSLGVFALESRSNLARLWRLKAGEVFPPLGWEQAAGYDGGDKGAEGGDGEGGALRANFKTTVYFEAGHPVDAAGMAKFRFTLPDNLGAFRLMAVAAGKGDRFGFANTTITTNRPLMARPMLPRALRVGDSARVGAAITSLGLPAGVATVSLETEGLSLSGAKSQQVSVAQNGQAEVRFNIVAKQSGKVSLRFDAALGGHRDAVRVTRDVEQPVRWLSASSFGVTRATAAITLPKLDQVRKDRGMLSLTLAPSALVGLGEVFRDLEQYPYGCTEQLSSRILPFLAAPELAAQQNINLPKGQLPWIDDALGQLISRMRDDGSFGFWEGDATQVPWLTAYALMTLEQASRVGYFVPRSTLDRVATTLAGTLDELLAQAQNAREPAAPDSERGTASETTPFAAPTLPPAEAQRRRLAEAVFIADALASVGRLSRAPLQELAVFEPELAVSAKAQLAHAMARVGISQDQSRHLLDAALAKTNVGEFDARVEVADPALEDMFDSPIRSSAWLLRAVIAVDPEDAVAPKLARGLVAARSGAGYRNTQEQAWALLALEEYRKSREDGVPDALTRVYAGDDLKQEVSFRALPVRAETLEFPVTELAGLDPASLALETTGKTPLYYSATLRVAKDGVSQVDVDGGLAVSKRMRGLDPSEMQAALRVLPSKTELTAKQGQLVLVDLLLETSEQRNQVVIEDPLPAGLEPIEFGFTTTTQALSGATDPGSEEAIRGLPRWGLGSGAQAVHREHRDDRVLLFLSQVNPGIHHLRYLARATTPGRFVMPPTRAECMYEPEVFGQTRAQQFEVKPGG